MGQHFLGLLAKTAGFVANPSSDDKAGWDFELESPNPTTAIYDSQSRPIYRIQVKATLSSRRSVAITYSSLLGLFQFPGPAYVFLVRFTSNGVPISGYLLHLDRERASAILKHMRQKEVTKGEDFKINKDTISLKVSDGKIVSSLTGDTLKSILSEEIGGSYLEYVQAKATWLTELEWESKALRFQVRFENAEAVQAMADGLLGFERPFQVDSVSYRAPFGIPVTIPQHSGVFRRSEVRPLKENIRPVRVKLGSRKFGARCLFLASMYSNVGVVPAQFSGGRIQASMFDILYRNEPPSIKLAPKDPTHDACVVPLRDFRNFVAFMEEASKLEEHDTYIEISPESGPPLLLTLPSQASTSIEHGGLQRVIDTVYARLDPLGLADERIATAKFFRPSGMLSFLECVGIIYTLPLNFVFDASEAITSTYANVVVFKEKIDLETCSVFIFAAFFGDVKKTGTTKFFGSFSRSEWLGEFVAPIGGDCGSDLEAYEENLKRPLREQGHVLLERSPDECPD